VIPNRFLNIGVMWAWLEGPQVWAMSIGDKRGSILKRWPQREGIARKKMLDASTVTNRFRAGMLRQR
jgi:hypothetical protein